MGKAAQTQRWNAEGGYLEKRCGRCGTWYPATAEYFIRNKKRADGLASRCKECNREVQRQWREENAAYWVQWREENAARKAEQDAAYRKRHRVEIRRKHREYIARTRAQRVEAQRAYYEANRDMIKARARAHYEANRAERLARKREYYRQFGNITPEERAAAGALYKADVAVGDETGPRGRIIGRRDGLWLVRLYDPLKVGARQFQEVLQVKAVRVYESTVGLYEYEAGEGA